MKKAAYSYALGEILIVIIGISIAFSMNKCSDNSRNERLKEQYLTSLKKDLEIDKTHLATNIEELSAKIKNANFVLPYLNSDSINKMKIVSRIFDIVQISNFNTKDVTYQTLINSGDFKLIDDFELKTAIESHYSNYKNMMNSYIRQESIVRDHLGNYLVNYADYDLIPKGQFPFANEKLLKNIVQSMRGSFHLKIEDTKKGLKSCDSLIINLDKALKN